MHPILFHIYEFPVFSYGFCLALGFILAALSAIEMGKKQDIHKDLILDLTLWTLICAIVGARLLYVIVDFSYYQKHPWEILFLNKGGLIFYGGFAGGVWAAISFIRKKKLPLWKTGDILLAVLPLGQMFGRLGCFLNGCCFGLPTLSAFKVTFPVESFACEYYQELQPVHPVQLYESIGLGILFLFLATLVERKRFDGQVAALYGLGYSILRFCMEFFRGDNPALALGFTLSQWISVFLFVVSLFLYAVLKKINGHLS